MTQIKDLDGICTIIPRIIVFVSSSPWWRWKSWYIAVYYSRRCRGHLLFKSTSNEWQADSLFFCHIWIRFHWGFWLKTNIYGRHYQNSVIKRSSFVLNCGIYAVDFTYKCFNGIEVFRQKKKNQNECFILRWVWVLRRKKAAMNCDNQKSRKLRNIFFCGTNSFRSKLFVGETWSWQILQSIVWSANKRFSWNWTGFNDGSFYVEKCLLFQFVWELNFL